MKEILIAGLIIYSFVLTSCTGQRSKCDKKDILCRSKELVEVLASNSFLDAEKYFEIDRDGSIAGYKKESYVHSFDRIHKNLVKYGLPNDSSYRIVNNPNPMLGKDVIVTLIDSSKNDKDYALVTVKFLFGNKEILLNYKILGYFVDSRVSKQSVEEGKKYFLEYRKEHPFPKDYIPPSN